MRNQKSRLTWARERRNRHEMEREDWTRLVHEFGGNVSKVANRMGCSGSTAKAALWDLGLWPTVQSYRRSDQKWTDMSLRSLVIQHHGKVKRIAVSRGKTFQSTRALLIRRGLWPLVERMRAAA